jgi:hypothetical protein
MTMRAARLLSLLALTFAALAVGSAHASGLAAPTGLHGFLLRADEPAQPNDSFPRTPSFAWDPVPGAIGYEFQLSTSNTFSSGDNAADNAIFYDTNTPVSPVVAPPLVLPWITGSPHGLYARVRATTPDGVTPWSADYGFDMEPDPAYPTPLPATAPGLLRWTPIEGADAYQVWLVDVPTPPGGKFVKTRTNVLDEREFYTFHQSQPWIGSIRWRVRAVRSIEGGAPANGFPVASYGQWSPIYRSTNPAPVDGPLQLGNTISDVIENGTATKTQPPHKLMPAFTWSGDQVQLPNGTTVTAELFRVEIFSDRQCLNMVYAGPIVGGYSWAPRAWGGSISLPDPSDLSGARASYPSDGGQGTTLGFDGTPIGSAEDLGPAGATASAPPDAIPAGASQSVSTAGPTATFSPVAGAASVGAPVDLWDTYWPDSGYYWTVMPVTPSLTTATGTVAAPGASKGSNVVPVADTSPFVVGQTITIGAAPNSDTAKITGVGGGLLTLNGALNLGHAPGEAIVVLGAGAGAYRDVMLPQDLCGSLRHEVGMMSEPAVVSPQDEAFVTGLSSTGKLISAHSTDQFYGRPLVAWTPALRAEKYEIEWSASDSPFVAAGNMLTTATAAVLPLTTGTWYYRVRGFDYNLPTGAQQMTWSTTEKLVVSKPTFKVVLDKTKSAGSSQKSAPTKSKSSGKTFAAYQTAKGNGFSVELPLSWKSLAASGFAYGSTDGNARVGIYEAANSALGKTDAQWAAAVKSEFTRLGSGPVSTAVVNVPAGKALRVTTTTTTKGKTTDYLEYVVQDGVREFVVAFISPQAKYASFLSAYGHAISTFSIG